MDTVITKPIHAKPSLFAVYFEPLKEIAIRYGYNLVIHGSLNRDMDLIAIPWQEEIDSHLLMIGEMAKFMGGEIALFNESRHTDGTIVGDVFTHKPHGRICYVINIFRGGYLSGGGFADMTYFKDPQYYLDISVIPPINI